MPEVHIVQQPNMSLSLVPSRLLEQPLVRTCVAVVVYVLGDGSDGCLVLLVNSTATGFRSSTWLWPFPSVLHFACLLSTCWRCSSECGNLRAAMETQFPCMMLGYSLLVFSTFREGQDFMNKPMSACRWDRRFSSYLR